MPTKTRRKDAGAARAPSTVRGRDGKPRKPKDKARDKGWDERLRLVGDARFVEVRWSGRDEPSWPLPAK